MVYIFFLCIHRPWNAWTTLANIQYTSLEDKEITQRQAIYADILEDTSRLHENKTKT